MHWIVDGNNVFGSRPDGWWNDRPAAQRRLAQQVAEWCRTHEDRVTLVFDAPLSAETAELAGGNLEITESSRRGRDAADHEIVELVDRLTEQSPEHTPEQTMERMVVVTSDRGLRGRLPDHVTVWGTGRFRALIE